VNVVNRARPVAAALLAVAGLVLVTACGSNPYATSGAVQPAALGVQQQQPASAVPAGAGRTRLVTSTVEGLGTVLADAEGRTLYRYAKDSAKPPKSVCDGACAQLWPPLVSATPALAAGVDAQLIGQVTRPDGGQQVTVGGWPVYSYSKDTGQGTALGQNVSADWAAITPTGEKAAGQSGSAATEPAKPTTIGTADVGGLGPVLTDRQGNTLYLFTKDGKDSGESTCDGACAKTWPPVRVDGRITVAESVDTGLIGRIRRPDGTMQVTVGGWPVYSYSKDSAPGEATGHGVGNTWYAVEPSGCKVDPARRPDAQRSAAASSGGY
jgi:predicted lipoprotein with Yx(FWY)xxD motif